MNKNDTNYYNVGGEQLYPEGLTRQQVVNSGSSGSSAVYQPMVRFVYDRIKHSAEVIWTGTELNTPVISTPATRSAAMSAPMTEEQIRANEAAAAEKMAVEKKMQEQ